MKVYFVFVVTAVVVALVAAYREGYSQGSIYATAHSRVYRALEKREPEPATGINARLSVVIIGDDGVLGVQRDVTLPFMPAEKIAFDMLGHPRAILYSTFINRVIVSFPEKKAKGKCDDILKMFTPPGVVWKETMSSRDLPKKDK